MVEREGFEPSGWLQVMENLFISYLLILVHKQG
jgi:hypothetical protein